MTNKAMLAPLIYAILIGRGKEMTIDEIQFELNRLGVKRKRQYVKEAVERLAIETPICPALIEIREGSERKYRALKLDEIKSVKPLSLLPVSDIWKLFGRANVAEDNTS